MRANGLRATAQPDQEAVMRILASTIASLGLAALLVGCGGGSKSEETTPASGEAAPAEEGAPEEGAAEEGAAGEEAPAEEAPAEESGGGGW
jgi:hypothetical protein